MVRKTNMSWELDLWGRVRSQAQAGAAAFEGAQYQLEWAYQSIAAQTAKIWFLVTEARLQEQLAAEAIALYAARRPPPRHRRTLRRARGNRGGGGRR